MEQAPTPKNGLVEFERGDSFAGPLMRAYMTESMRENRKKRVVYKTKILANLYDHYAREWATQAGKSGQMTSGELADRTAYISSISPDKIAILLKD